MNDTISRRNFFQVTTMALLGGGVLAGAATGRADGGLPGKTRKTRITRAHIGEAVRYLDLHGDEWTTTWADDGNLYSAADDTRGLKSSPIDSNLAVFRIVGGPPPQIRVETVNPMSAFGKCTEVKKEDNACWKASGLTCVDGVLYLSVCRHHYMDERGFWVEQSWDASIIKSTDHGQTWSAAPSLDRAMFPGRVFSNPYFVQYGQDGRGTKDGAERYVYAVSNDGAWNNGNSMTMGRVRRERIGRLDPGDWEFVHGYGEDGEPIWRPRHDNALYIFRAPGRVGMTGIFYNAGLDLYIMPQWYHPYLNDPWAAPKWNITHFDFYEAPAPWGPWSLFHSHEFSPQGYYCPSIPAKFISEDGLNFWMFAAGDSIARNDPYYYTINMIPVTLEVEG